MPVLGSYSSADVSPEPPTGAARPIGIVILTIVEIVVGVGGLFVAADLLRWAIVSNYYQEAESTVDLVIGLAYLALPIPAFIIAWAAVF